MKKIFALSALMLMTMVAFAAKQTVLFSVDIHCEGCVKKIEKNIAFEKGVKDLQCDLTKKTVLVTYDDTKTDVKTLQAAFEKIGKPATVVTPGCKGQGCQHHCGGEQGCQHSCSGQHSCDGQHKTDAQSGATTAK